MEHQLGRVHLVAWQGRRLRMHTRRDAAVTALAGLCLAAVVALLLRFALGLDIPLVILQAAFAVLVSAAALLMTRAAASLLIRAQRR